MYKKLYGTSYCGDRKTNIEVDNTTLTRFLKNKVGLTSKQIEQVQFELGFYFKDSSEYVNYGYAYNDGHYKIASKVIDCLISYESKKTFWQKFTEKDPYRDPSSPAYFPAKHVWVTEKKVGSGSNTRVEQTTHVVYW